MTQYIMLLGEGGVNRLETSVEMTFQGQTPPWETLHPWKKEEAYPLGT